MTTFEFPDQFIQREDALAKERETRFLSLLRDQGYRHDALQFSTNQLEHLSSTILDELYSNPVDAFRFLPINTEPADGMTEWSYRILSKLGAARVVADGATDRPLVDANLVKTTVDIYEFGSGYTFTVGDQARSGSGILDFPYVQTKARYAAEDIARAHNGYALLGGSAVTDGPDTTGFFNNATVVTNIPTATDIDWQAVTGVNAYQAIQVLVQEPNNGSNGVHSATDCILSTRAWNLCQAELLNSAAGSQTVLSALRANFPEVTFHKSESLRNQGASGAGYDRCVAYERSASNVEYVASVIYDESQPVNSGFRWTVHSRGRSAGTVVKRPLSMAYLDLQFA